MISDIYSLLCGLLALSHYGGSSVASSRCQYAAKRDRFLSGPQIYVTLLSFGYCMAWLASGWTAISSEPDFHSHYFILNKYILFSQKAKVLHSLFRRPLSPITCQNLAISPFL